MRNICMRWVWWFQLRSWTTKCMTVFSMSIFVTLLLLQNQKGDYLKPEINQSDVDPQIILDLQESKNHVKDTYRTIPNRTLDNNVIHEPFTDWLEVKNSQRDVFVYSSYLDSRGKFRHVRVIAIMKRGRKVSQCELKSGNETVLVQGRSKNIRENWSLLYSAAFVMCDLPSGILNPESVALVYNNNVDKTSSVPVQVMASRVHHGSMSVCIKPFHYEFNRALWLIEFIEFYRLLGADHFIFYNHTVGPDVQKLLKYYEENGIATVLPWSLPVKSQKEIRTEGIFAALNDCNYRSIGRFDLTAFVDVDEFLIPRSYSKLTDLIADVGSYDTYVFQNVFFYLYWENDTVVNHVLFTGNQSTSLGVSYFGDVSQIPYLLTLYKTRRLISPHKPGVRSKYIVQPQKVVEVGNHNVWEYLDGKYKKVLNVPVDKALSHHYRICEYGGFDCLKLGSKIDRSTHKWLVPLTKRIAEQCQQIFPWEQKCPVAPPLGSPW